MKQIVITLIFLNLSAGCRNPEIQEPGNPSLEKKWYEGIANVSSIDPYCQEKPVLLFFTYMHPDGVLPITWAWTYSLPDSLKSTRNKVRFLYTKATGEDILECGNIQDHPNQIIIKDIEITK